MERTKMKDLLEWQKSKNRKPLLLLGARQVGKTYLTKEFGRINYDNVMYINFEKRDYSEVFEDSLDPLDIIAKLSIIESFDYDPNKNTLIIFDEIQVCPKAITSLKYFNEEYNDQHIIALGSLLGVSLNRSKISFPVGKVDRMFLYPMTFIEFLIATTNTVLISAITDCILNNKKIDQHIHNKAKDLLLDYYYVGGMPEAVNDYINKSKKKEFINEKIVENIYNNYVADMAKYSDSNNTMLIQKLYLSIHTFLMSDNLKIKFTQIIPNKRKNDFSIALEWLKSANNILDVNNTKKIQSPIKVFNDDSGMKIFFSDLGILKSAANINLKDYYYDSESMYKGAIAENYVAIHLKEMGYNLNYYKKSTDLEVDFLIEDDGDIIPIEVKYGKNVRSDSMNKYNNKYNPKKLIKLSTKEFSINGNLYNIPLYAIFLLKDILIK